jgi:hypothetical protein
MVSVQINQWAVPHNHFLDVAPFDQGVSFLQGHSHQKVDSPEGDEQSNFEGINHLKSIFKSGQRYHTSSELAISSAWPQSPIVS